MGIFGQFESYFSYGREVLAKTKGAPWIQKR
jgi:hypothetical protein